MLEIFSYSFMLRAIFAGTIIAIISPLIGTFLISKRYALMADTLAHVCLAGVAIGLLTKVYPLYTAIVVAILAAIAIEKLSKDKKISGDSTLSLFLSGGLALATVLISFAKGFNSDLFSYLFGSITTVSGADLWLIAIIGTIVILTLLFLYKEIMYTAFDEESAKVSGVAASTVSYLFIIITAVTIAISVRIVGALLVGALMVIPVLTASQIARSFRQTIFLSICFGLFFVLAGIFLSYYLDLATGGSIVLFSIICFVCVKLFKSS